MTLRPHRSLLLTGLTSLLSLVLLLVLTVVTAPSGRAATLPDPRTDPFYDVPADVARYAPGEIIASRPVSAKAFEVPLPVRAWQLKYRTADHRGRPTATLTTVLVPITRWKGPGPRPLVSHQFAEDGVGRLCAPSVALAHGLRRGGFTNSYGETGFDAAALARGWAVTVPDYEGPDSLFLVAGMTARGVLDGVRATKSFAAAGLGDSPVALWGYSGGAYASSLAAQLAPTYAPELNFVGLALGGLLGGVRETIDAFDGSYAGGAIPMGINGFVRAYPEVKIENYLNARGRRLVAVAANDCAIQAALRDPFLKMSQIEAFPNALHAPPVAAMLAENSPMNFPGVPRVPTLWYHARTDELAPFGAALRTVRRFCAAGTTVQTLIRPVGEHIQELVTDSPAALSFLAARFAGKPPVNTCAALPD